MKEREKRVVKRYASIVYLYIRCNLLHWTISTSKNMYRHIAMCLIKYIKHKKANKSERWMPRLWEAMKDVISCDKLGGGANNL